MPSQRSGVSDEADQFIKILSSVLSLSRPRKWDETVWPADLQDLLTRAYENAYGKPLNFDNWREVKGALQLAVPTALKRWVQMTDTDTHYAAGALIWFQYVNPLANDEEPPQNPDVQKRLSTPTELKECFQGLGLPTNRWEEFQQKIVQAYTPSRYSKLKSEGIQKLWDSLTERLPAKRSPNRLSSTDNLIRRSVALAQVIACVDTACARHLPIVVHGPPAVGKQALLRLLANEPEILARWPAGPILLALGDEQHTTDDIQLLIKTRLGIASAGPKLVFIDNCSVAAPIQAVLDVLPEASLVVVTTCDSQVVHELAPSDVTVVSIGPFTFEEAEAFYRAMWQAQPGVDDLTRLRQVHEQVRGNPLGLKLALHQVKARGWAETLLALSEPPLPTPAGISAELCQPLYQAYKLLVRKGLAAYGARLGALPQLEAYDIETFTALWEMTPGRVSDVLATLEQDAGLVSRRSSTSWEIHQQVLHYAASLLAQASFDEQQAAYQWLARLTARLEQRHVYRQFRAQQPRLGLRAIVKLRRETKVPIQGALLKRVIRRVRFPNEVVEWQMVQEFSRNFTSGELALASQLQADERRSQRLLIGGLASGLVALMIVGVLNIVGSLIEDFVLVYYPFAMALLISTLVVLAALGIRFVLIDVTREPAWLALWQQARLRREAETSNTESSPG